MAEKFEQFKERILSTDYPHWRNNLSCAVLIFLATGMVFAWWYIYYTTYAAECHKGALYVSVIWLAVQWVVIGYLHRYYNIPAFAREAIKLMLFMGNIWFGFFVFLLQPCAQ